MKLCIKKIYCPDCRRSVAAQEQSGNGQDRIVCSKCGRAICVSNGVYWRQAQAGESILRRDIEGGYPGKGKKGKVSRN